MLRSTTTRCVSTCAASRNAAAMSAKPLLAFGGPSASAPLCSTVFTTLNNTNNTTTRHYHGNYNPTTTITQNAPITEPTSSGISSVIAGGTTARRSTAARYPICASAPLNAYLPESVSTVIARTAQGLLAQQQRLASTSSAKASASTAESSDVSPTLYENIYFAPEQNAVQGGPTYVEVNRHELRLEFLDISDAFTQHAALMFDADVAAVDVAAKQSKIPSCFIPRKVENNISHGAGATIVLDKQEVLDYFKNQARL